MMVKIFQVDAFAAELFGGNPAAVIPLQEWLPDAVMQSIAAENNLAETAFFVPQADGKFHLRWFTPALEVPLCGHATLASGHVLFAELGHKQDIVTFTTLSGELTVRRAQDGYAMDLPLSRCAEVTTPSTFAVADLTGAVPKEIYDGAFLMAVFEKASEIREMKPDFAAIAQLTHKKDGGALLVTAPGDEGFDFVSRYFAPGWGIAEDPVTGSAHCQLAPFWAQQLGKTRLSAYQASPRGGIVDCEIIGERVLLRGPAVTYLRGDVVTSI